MARNVQVSIGFLLTIKHGFDQTQHHEKIKSKWAIPIGNGKVEFTRCSRRPFMQRAATDGTMPSCTLLFSFPTNIWVCNIFTKITGICTLNVENIFWTEKKQRKSTPKHYCVIYVSWCCCDVGLSIGLAEPASCGETFRGNRGSGRVEVLESFAKHDLVVIFKVYGPAAPLPIFQNSTPRSDHTRARHGGIYGPRIDPNNMVRLAHCSGIFWCFLVNNQAHFCFQAMEFRYNLRTGSMHRF